MTVVRLLFVAALLALGGAVQAQPVDAVDLLRAVREATERLDYATAEARAREALVRYNDFAPNQLVELHTTLGTLLAARGDDIGARQQFDAALSINPGLTLDPILVPPQTVELFESVRRDRVAATTPTAGGPPELRYVILRDPRPDAALRSALLPGWGQFHKGDRGRGFAFAVGVGALAAGTVGTHIAYRIARTDYRNATDPAEIDRTYRASNRFYQTRNALAVATALGWAASIAEALTTGGPEDPAPAVQVAPAEAGAGLGLRVRF